MRSAVCDTEIVVIRGGSEPEVDLRCGGQPMVLAGEAALDGLELTESSGTVLGKRYVHETSGLEVLCTKAGAGGLCVGSELLPVMGAKPLPSSD